MEKLYRHLRYWDSDLVFTANIETEVNEVLNSIKDKFQYDPVTGSVSIDPILFSQGFPELDAYDWRGDGIKDYTCVAKGYFIDKVRELVEEGKKFMINFGGDIYTNDSTLVETENCRMNIHLMYGGYIFCSTNSKRPGHIPGAKWDTVYVVGEDWFDNGESCAKFDAKATQCLASPKMDPYVFYINQDGLVANKTYIASPFFNSRDTMIRDRMAERFSDPIRPDLLNPNIEGNLNKDKELADKIRQDNLDAIDSCSILVFPKNTTDLGTLFEVGYAIRKGKLILRYDYDHDLYELFEGIRIPDLESLGLNAKDVVLDLNKLGSGIILGCYYDSQIPYYLGEAKDNIMLHNNPQVEKPAVLYPSYCVDLLSETVYHLNTLTSGS